MSNLVFISYSWDNERHKEWVLNLAEQLVNNGIDVILDQYDLSLGMEMTHFMEKSVTADKVLVILTPNYKLKADKREGGVGYEYSLISKEYYNNEPNKTRIFPILRNGDNNISSPSFMQTRIYHDMRENEKFDSKLFELIKLIIGRPLIKKPALGKLPNFDEQIPDVEKTLQDYKKKEEYFGRKQSIINSEEGRKMFLNEINKIIDQISKTLQNYQANFQLPFWVKTRPSESILFSTVNYTYYIGASDIYYNSASNALVNMNFFKGMVGFQETGIFQSEEPQNIYITSCKFDLDENFDPIFIRTDNSNIKFTSHDVATIAIREVIANEIKLKQSKLM